MKQKHYDVEGSIAAGWFLKYGYLILILLSAVVIFFLNISVYYYFLPVGFIFLMSLHTIIAAYLFQDHFICFSQLNHRYVMDPTIKYSNHEIKKMKKEAYIIGFLFLICSFGFTAVIIFQGQVVG